MNKSWRLLWQHKTNTHIQMMDFYSLQTARDYLEHLKLFNGSGHAAYIIEPRINNIQKDVEDKDTNYIASTGARNEDTNY